jgi:hypothetical protein
MLKLAPLAMASDASATGWRVDLPFAHMVLARVYAKRGQAKEGLSVARRGRDCHAARLKPPDNRGPISSINGAILLLGNRRAPIDILIIPEGGRGSPIDRDVP